MERFKASGGSIWDTKNEMYVDAWNDEALRILNSHDDLVAALKMARHEWVSSIDSSGPEDWQQAIIKQIDAALAKAEGGK